MYGAEVAVETLKANGVDVYFTNPGTSEMHFVSAIDKVDGVRVILGLFEGVVTGAADGYGRMAGKPAATLLHLGPGLGNGIANLHNANRAHTPVVNIIGDHAASHLALDAPLTSDIEGLARPVSSWYHSVENVAALAGDCQKAVVAAMTGKGQVATLTVPADVAWLDGGSALGKADIPARSKADDAAINHAAEALKSDGKAVLFIGADALLDKGLEIAGRIAEATGCRLMCPTFNGRISRGAGRVKVDKLPYFAEMAMGELAGNDHLILLGADAPVSFFAYPGKPGWLTPEGCELHKVATAHDDVLATLEALADAVGAKAAAEMRTPLNVPSLMPGELNAISMASSIMHHMPEGAIISDEAATSAVPQWMMSMTARPHDWLDLTGGAIGQGLPVAVGAAVACPDRKVIALQADGSAMYTLQSLWSMARENLDVTTVIFANRSYAILNIEFARVGAGAPGEKARSMLSIDNPELGFADMARGMGVESVRVETVEDFDKAFKAAMSRKGPFLIEAMIDPVIPQI